MGNKNYSILIGSVFVIIIMGIIVLLMYLDDESGDRDVEAPMAGIGATDTLLQITDLEL